MATDAPISSKVAFASFATLSASCRRTNSASASRFHMKREKRYLLVRLYHGHSPLPPLAFHFKRTSLTSMGHRRHRNLRRANIPFGRAWQSMATLAEYLNIFDKGGQDAERRRTHHFGGFALWRPPGAVLTSSRNINRNRNVPDPNITRNESFWFVCTIANFRGFLHSESRIPSRRSPPNSGAAGEGSKLEPPSPE